MAAVPAAGGHRPERRVIGDLGDCNDRIRIVGADVICVRAQLGHLSVYIFAGASAPLHGLHAQPHMLPRSEAGLHWQPLYRSLWSVTLAATTEGRAEFHVRRILRI